MSTSSWQLCFFFVFWMTVSVRSACLQGWDERDGSCFKVYNYQMKWSSGSQRCNSMYTGAHLIYVKDRTLDFLKKLTDFNTGHEYHVGGRKNSALIFKWGDGSLVKVSLIDTSSVGNYLKIKGWENGILMLYSSDENYSAKIICEYRPRLSTSSSSPLLPSSSLLSSSSSSSLQPLSSSSSSLQPLSSSSFSTYFLQPSTSPQALLSSSSSPPSSSSSSSSSSSLSLSLSSSSSSSSLSLSLSSSSSSSSSLSPSLSLPSASLPSSSTLSSSLSASPSLSPSPSLSQSPSTSIHNVSSLSLSSDQTTRMEVLSPTSTRQRPSSSSIVNTANGETLISRFINDLNKLNISASTALEEGVNLTQIFLETNHKTQQKTENHLLASKELETFALRFTEYHLNNKEMLITTKNIVVLASNVRNASEDFVFLVPESTQTTQPTKVIIPIEDMNRKDTSIVVIHYSNLDVLVQKLQQDKRTSIQSHIIAATMKPRKNALVKNVTLGFNINESSSNTNHCNFWNFTTKVPGWSRDGCTVSKATNLYVECSCNHLTHFAVLMQVDDIKISEEHDNILTILTYIGLSLSILGCLLTFLAYLTLTDVQSEQSQIRMNLVAFLAVAHSLFLLNSLAKQYLFSCVAVAVLTQFFYTSALCWMCAEGVLLYQHIVKVFNTNLNMKHVYCSAWGIPTILVICSLSIAGNEDSGLGSLVSDDFCWLSVKNHLIWVFIAPVLMLILFNLVILGMVIKELSRISKPNCGSTLDTLRTNIKAFALLSPLLGLTWLTGLLCILGAGLVGVYIFTILNSTQGFFIFILYCLRSSEIRLKLQRKIKVMDESTPKKISSVPPVKTLNVQYKPTSSPQEKLVLSDFDQSGLKDTTTKETR